MTITTLRKQLQSAAQREPDHIHPFIEQIDRQLRNYARSNAEDRIALRPQIEGSIKRLEEQRAAGVGR